MLGLGTAPVTELWAGGALQGGVSYLHSGLSTPSPLRFPWIGSSLTLNDDLESSLPPGSSPLLIFLKGREEQRKCHHPTTWQEEF